MDYHEQKPWHAWELEEVYEMLHTSEGGLGDAEADERLSKYGRNELRRKPPKTVLQMLKAQIMDPMVLILIGAAVFSAVLQQGMEAAVIFIIVGINAVIGIVQEKKAQSSMEALRSMSAPQARVLRQGEESRIEAAKLVAGDIIFLNDGDMAPADLRLVHSVNLRVQEAALTGESLPAEKDAGAKLPVHKSLGERSNMVYASSIVTGGRAVGVAVATGMDTEMGRIAGLLDGQDELDTPLKRKLAAAGKTLTIAGLIVCVLVFGIGALYGRPLVPQFLLAIALAISIIPEGLPATATIVMALGVQRMAGKNALVRRLPAVETLGGATVICSDKTGTLTQNRMTVTRIAVNGDFEAGRTTSPELAGKQHQEVYRELVYAAALCNDAGFDPDRPGEILGDPTEGALLQLALEFGVNAQELEEKYPRTAELPFDSDRKRMTTVHRMNGRHTAYTKGAVDQILPLCTHMLTAQGMRPITEQDLVNIRKLCRTMSEKAMRVLGFATKEKEGILEKELTFIGITGMIDPPRKEVKEAVQICRDAGIRTVMITGDHPVTALAIAKELDIYREGEGMLTGEELAAIENDELAHKIRNITVFARVSPADKLRIIKTLKRNGEVTAMTGDGVNDAPALKAADIGVAMGKEGTDVARDASDLILLDDSFTTIVCAIREGRLVYRNIQKVIQFLLAGNIAEILTLFAATVLNQEAPLLAVHILWVNLATATLPALALGVDPAGADIMKKRPVKSGTMFEKNLIYRVITQGILTAVLTTAAYLIGDGMGGHAAGRTMAFAVLAFSQILRAFEGRHFRERKNPWLFQAVAVSALLMLGILLIPALQTAFSVTALSALQWVAVMALSGVSLLAAQFFLSSHNA